MFLGFPLSIGLIATYIKNDESDYKHLLTETKPKVGFSRYALCQI